MRTIRASFIYVLFLMNQACIPGLDRAALNLVTFLNLNSLLTEGNRIGVNVDGLEGEGFTLGIFRSTQDLNAPGDPITQLSIESNGRAFFPAGFSGGFTYRVAILSPPRFPLQECTITPADGVVGETEGHQIQCTTIGYPVRVNTRALAGSQLVLANNGDNLTITGNGISTFPNDVLIGGNFNVSIVSQPQNHFCNISPTTGPIINSEVILEANCFSPISISPANNGILPPNQPIRIVFSDSIDGSGLQEIGTATLSTSPAPITSFTQTNIPGDTLIIQPGSGGWSPGAGRSVTFAFTSSSGLTMPGGNTTLTYTVPSQIRYVSNSGLDSNDGLTPSTPFRNIQTAITNIGTCPGLDCLVMIEEGNFPATVAVVPTSDFITLVEGVSLQGGYIPGSGFSQRNNSTINTIIDMPLSNGTCNLSTQAAPCRAVFAGTGITPATILESLRIVSRNADFTVAVFAEGSPRILNTILIGGNLQTASTGISAGIRSVNSNFRLENSTSRGGVCGVIGNISAGIVIGGTGASTPFISNSVAEGGLCDFNNGRSIGLQLAGNGTINLSNVIGNTFRTVDHPINTNSSSAIGIENTNSNNLVIGGNTVIAGSSQVSFGVRNTGPITFGTSASPMVIQVPQAVRTATGFINTASVSVTITNTTIEMGNVLGDSGISKISGIESSGTSSLIVRDTNITLGSITAQSTQTATMLGISSDATGLGSTILRNRIRLGTTNGASTSSITVGVQWSSASAPIIANNIIFGGTTPHRIYGINVTPFNQPIRMEFNTIRINSGNPDSAAILSGAGLNNIVSISNNILFNPLSPCLVYGSNPPSGSGRVRNNNFNQCTTKVFVTGTSTSFTDICGTGTLGQSGQMCMSTFGGGGAEFVGNTDEDPMLANAFANPPNFSPTISTPCEVAQSSLILPVDVGLDIFEETRPSSPPGPTMGAIQWNGGCL